MTMAMRRAGGLLAALLAGAVAFAEGEAPKAFDTPEALVDAMVEAAANNDDAAIRALAGGEHADLVQPGTDPTVAKIRAEFAENAKTFRRLEDNEDGSKTLVIGDARWPFPVPLVKREAGWVLDGAAGREELLARRIGRNELTAIKLCRAYAGAQEAYAAKDRDGDGVREYAQRIQSTPGRQDGLWWETGEDGEESPLGPLVEPAREALAGRAPTDPVGGYFWRILTAQGGGAPGGAYSYVINGNMVAGYALVGFPAEYRETGVMTFLVSRNGVVLQKDLGPDTAGVVRCMFGFTPDDTWTAVED
jgi:hypothetical protein